MKSEMMTVALSFFLLTNVALAADQQGMNQKEFNIPKRISENSPSIGLRLGVVEMEGTQYDTSAEFGAELGFQPIPQLGLGLEFGIFNSDPAAQSLELTRSKLLAKVLYNFTGNTPFIRYSYVGVGLGPVWDKIGNQTFNEFGLAPMLGFDIPIPDNQSQFTLGANASYLFIEDQQVPGTFALNGAVKYWF